MRISKAIGGAVMAVVCSSSLVSCATHWALDPAAIQARGLKPGEGYIVATFRHATMDSKTQKITNTPGGAPIVGIKKEPSSDQDGSILLEPRVAKLNAMPGTGAASDVVAIPVPAGDYAVTAWVMNGQAMTTTIQVTNRLPFKAPFQVKPGETTYLGRVNALTLTGPNRLGLTVFGTGLVMLTDDFPKDQPRIAQFYPSIKPATIHRSAVPAEYQKEMARIASTPEERTAFQKLLGLH
jgi:hypothetical protein